MSQRHHRWDFLETSSIFCICLKDRDDRFEHACKEFKKVGLLDRVIFHRPEKHPDGGRIGCWESHAWCIQEAYRRRDPYALIFEDDIIFEPDFQLYLPHVAQFLQQEPEWDLLRLGGYVLKYYEPSKSDDQIWRNASLQSHAYFVNHSYIEAFVHRAPSNTNHIDAFFLHTTTMDYSLLHPIVYQDAALGSDNIWSYVLDPIPIDFGRMAQRFAQNFLDFEQLQKINNTCAAWIRHVPESIRWFTLPNVIHHQVKEPVRLI